VLEIRVEPDAEGDVGGAYEKLLAKEVAHRVLTAPMLVVFEASYQPTELGRTPTVMSTTSVEFLWMPAQSAIA